MNLKSGSWTVSGGLWIIAALLSGHDTWFVIGMLALILAKMEGTK
jgi:hypothetical protein